MSSGKDFKKKNENNLSESDMESVAGGMSTLKDFYNKMDGIKNSGCDFETRLKMAVEMCGHLGLDYVTEEEEKRIRGESEGF